MNNQGEAAGAAEGADGAQAQAEGKEQAGAAAAAAAAEGQQQAQQGGGEEEAPPPKSSRDAIYSRHRDIRARAAAEDPERMAANAVMAGQGEQAPAGESDGDAPAGDGQQQQSQAEGGEKSLALDKRMHKLTVEGKEIEVPEDEILEAGRRTLQKDHSADLKLRRAASAEQLAAERLAEADRVRKQALENSGRLPSSGAGPDDASSHLSAQDAGESTEAIAKAGASQARDVLFDEGDPDKAAQVLLASSRKSVVEATNRMFARDFSEITTDPALFQRAATMMRTEMQGKDFASFPVIATRIGNQLMAERLAQQVQAENGGEQDTTGHQAAPGAAQSRAATKVRLPAVPSRATTKTTDTRAASPQRKTPSEIVHQMRVARGQVRPT